MYRGVEVFGMFCHRVGELLACLDVLLDPQQHKLEPGVFGLLGDTLDGSENRIAGTNHHGQLAGEVENVASIGPGRLIECLGFLAQRLTLGADGRQGPVELIWGLQTVARFRALSRTLQISVLRDTHGRRDQRMSSVRAPRYLIRGLSRRRTKDHFCAVAMS